MTASGVTLPTMASTGGVLVFGHWFAARMLQLDAQLVAAGVDTPAHGRQLYLASMAYAVCRMLRTGGR